MPELRAFKATDWTLLRRDFSPGSALAGVVREQSGMAFTACEPVEDGEKILGSAGIVVQGKSGAGWALLTEELKRDHKLWFHRIARKYLWAVIDTLELVRVEMLVNPEIEANCRWIERLGFENKRLKEKAGENSEDMLEYVWLRPSLVGIRREHERESSATSCNGSERLDIQP